MNLPHRHDAVLPGHENVRDDEIGTRVREQLEARGAVIRLQHLVLHPLQGATDRSAHRLVVVDHDDPRHHRNIRTVPAVATAAPRRKPSRSRR